MNALDTLAKVYTDHRRELMALMQQHGVSFTASPTHGQVISALYKLMKTDESFNADLENLLSKYHNQTGGIIAGIFETVGNAVAPLAQGYAENQERKTQEEEFFQDYLLEKQKNSSNTVVWIIVGGSVLLVGVALIFILRK